MGYKMIEITTEKQGELMEHAEKAYKHVGKMLECIEQMGAGKMGQREDDEWYIRRMGERSRYGMRDDNMMGERRHYGSRMGYRDPYYD